MNPPVTILIFTQKQMVDFTDKMNYTITIIEIKSISHAFLIDTADLNIRIKRIHNQTKHRGTTAFNRRRKLEYQKFLEFVKENLAELLPEGTEIEICRIPRNNSVIIDSIVIHTPGNSLYPSIPVNPLYEQYKNGESMTSILQQIKNCLYEGLSKEATLVQAITDPAAVRANVVCRLVNRKRNEKVLKEIPYKPFLDLAVTYHYELEGLKDKRGSIMIRNEFM